MKSINKKYFVAIGTILVLVSGLLYFGQQSNVLRFPASGIRTLDTIVVDRFDVQDGFEIYMGFENEEQNICDDREEMILTLRPEGLVVHSDSEDGDHEHESILLEIVNGCERGFVSPIFKESFCGNADLNIEDDEGTTYELKNGPGVFPLNWKVQSLTIGGVEVSMDNQLGLSEYPFSCE